MNPSRIPNTGYRIPNRGSVLIIVLITLLFATFALTAFMHRASGDLIVATREADARSLRKDAYSAMETTLAVLSSYMQANNGILRSPAEGWGDPLAFAEYAPPEGQTIEVTFEDESGKLPLPNVDVNQLRALFKVFELDDNDAQEVADALMTWMRPNFTAASTFTPSYDLAPIPYAPPTRSLRSYSELASIDSVRDRFFDAEGLPTAMYSRFVAATSLYNFARPNFNAAPPDVLITLAALDENQLAAVLKKRTGDPEDKDSVPGYFTGQAQAAPLTGQSNIGGFNYQVSALRINITVREGRASYKLSGLVTPILNGQPAAQTVQAAATPGTAAASGRGAGARGGQPAPPAPPTQGGRGATQTSINYPFTVLEFHEDTVAPPQVAVTKEE